MAGRIEVYVHSDSTTENKGAIAVKVTTTTDFAARTDVFKAFAKKAAMLTYGALPMRNYVAASDIWHMVIAKFPELEDERKQVERELKEPVTVCGVALLRLSPSRLVVRPPRSQRGNMGSTPIWVTNVAVV